MVLISLLRRVASKSSVYSNHVSHITYYRHVCCLPLSTYLMGAVNIHKGKTDGLKVSAEISTVSRASGLFALTAKAARLLTDQIVGATQLTASQAEWRSGASVGSSS